MKELVWRMLESSLMWTMGKWRWDQDDEATFIVFEAPKECLRVEAQLVTQKKETTSGMWKEVAGCFKPTQQELEELDD